MFFDGLFQLVLISVVGLVAGQNYQQPKEQL